MKKFICLDFCSITVLIITLYSKCIAGPAEDCDRSQGHYLHKFLNGTDRCCKWVECPPGLEVVVCQNPYTADHCRPCIPPFIQPDETNSELVVACYSVPMCPEFSKPDKNGQCHCDLDSGFYGELYYDCTYVKCPEGHKLTKWGNCTFKNVDLVTIETMPKLEQSPNDKNDIFGPGLGKVHEVSHQGAYESTIEGDKKYASYSTKKSVNNFGDNKTNDHRPEEVPVITEKASNYIESFLYDILGASVLVILLCLVLGCIFYVWWKQKKNHAHKLELRKYYKKNIKLPTLGHSWKPFPESILPLQLEFPGQSEFHKLPNIIPTPFASLPIKLEVGQSIGIIHMGNIPWGTGFVVGGSHIMTCFHTIYLMLGIKDDTKKEIVIRRKISQLIHKIAISFHFNDADSRNCNKFTFEKIVPYFDIYLDVIVLKINRSCMSEQTLPMPLSKFCDFNPNDQFDFFGHPLGKEKQVDQYCRIKLINSSKTAEMVTQVGDYLIRKGFDPQNFYDPYYGIQDNNLYTFTTVFVHGGSGSPGVICTKISNISPLSYAVGTMLCGQYPKFKPYDINHDDLDPELTVQFGPKMSSVFQSIARKNPSLLRQVFEDFPPDWNEE